MGHLMMSLQPLSHGALGRAVDRLDDALNLREVGAEKLVGSGPT